MLWACFKDEVPEALQCLEAALSLAVLCPGSPSTAVRLPLLCVPGCLAPFVRIHSETTSSARQLVSTDAGSRLCKVTVTEGKSHRTGLFPAGGMPAHLSVHVEASLTLLARFLNLRCFLFNCPLPPPPSKNYFLAADHIPTDCFLHAMLIQVKSVSYILYLCVVTKSLHRWGARAK